MLCQQTQKMVLGQTSQRMVFGVVDMNGLSFFVRVFNPYAPSNQTPTTKLQHSPVATGNMKTFKKKREYKLQIREVEWASFTQIVLSSTGGMGTMATTTYKRLASLLVDKYSRLYNQTMGWLCCCLSLSFSILRSSIQCIRGARPSQGHAIHLPPSIELIVSESMIPLSI